MQTFKIKNRYSLKIVGDILIPQESIGLVFLLHGLGSSRKRELIQDIAKTFYNNKYIVINFDATNSTGESEGKYENATMQLHYEDLIDVILWAKSKEWYQQPFILAGHSLGGYAVLQYTEDYPKEVKSVFAFAATISGKFSFEAKEQFESEEFKKYKETGWTSRISKTTGKILNLPYSHMEERLKHDLITDVKNIKCPILMISGEKDTSCPPEHQKTFFELLSSEKEIHIIPGAPHTFKKQEDLEKMKEILNKWVQKIR